MITEDYVSFETAKLLKEKGFDEITEQSYTLSTGYDTRIPCCNSVDTDRVSRITLQIAMKWLRIEHNIHIEILMTNHSMSERFDIPKYYWVAVGAKTSKWITESTLYSAKQFDTNEEACEAAIKHCLEKLI